MTERRYEKVEEYLKHRIQKDFYRAKDSMPSENEL